MTGVAAVAMCAAFTSCSKDSENYSFNSEQIAQNEFESRLTKYKESFVNNFGQPAANQTWGFGVGETRGAMTRTHDANANEWAAEKGGNWIVPDVLTDAQIEKVYKYFQQKELQGVSITFTNFFVQQVYKGGTKPNTAVSPEQYTAADGSTKIVGGQHIDYLTAGTIHDHINNFNNGDAGTTRVLDNNGDVNSGPWHNDKIMLMVNSSTNCFGYWNSNGSVGFDDKFIIIPGADIDASLKGRYFVGFDFEQVIGDAAYAKDWQTGGIAYYTAADGTQVEYLSDQMNQYCADVESYNDVPSTDQIATLISNGYHPVAGKADKTWAKLKNCADGVYSDWIVCITEGLKKGSQKDIVRVIAEDMAGYLADDFDFNDVVFDCELDANKNVTSITLVHTGAEFSITVDGVEVHEAFGLQKNPNRPQYWTMGSGSYTFTPSKTYKVGDIPVVATQIVEVKKEDGTIDYQSKDITLEAPTGMTTGKIAVRPDFGVIPERQNIDTYTNKKFSQYVQNGGQWDTWYK